jgi:hypothetical protein
VVWCQICFWHKGKRRNIVDNARDGLVEVGFPNEREWNADVV